jgi:RNA polymerase sigma-70 factor (ECF subfamily)
MQTGDFDDQIRTIFHHHYTEVLAYCTRRIGRNEADDAAAEVFAIAWKRIDDIDMEAVRPWLYGTARRVLSNRWRSLQRQSRLAKRVSALAAAPSETPEVFVVRREQDGEVVKAVRTLKVDDQEVLMLAGWEGLTAGEIGVVLEISTSAAEQRLHRAKKRLARALEPLIMAQDFSQRAAHEGGGR